MTMNLFSADFKIESSSGSGEFLNLPAKDGDSIRFAVLDAGVTGYRYWNQDNKPVNLREKPATTPADIRTGGQYPDRVKQFAALVVWDYEGKRVCIFQCDNHTVLGTIREMVQSGDVSIEDQYFRVARSKGAGGKVAYTVTAPVCKGDFPAPTSEQRTEGAELDVEGIVFRPPSKPDLVDLETAVGLM